MIIEFSIGNFRSIKEIQTLNMSAANISSKYKEVDEQNVHYNIGGKYNILKSKAIYGANASGKSNFIKALSAFKAIVTKSVKDDSILRLVEPFQLSKETIKAPTFFQLSFIVNNIFYRYGFQATQDKIESEWLFGTPGKKEVPFFTRENDVIEVNENQYYEGSKLKDLYGGGRGIVRDNSLFLTAVESLNGNISLILVNYISKIILLSGLSDIKLHTHAIEAITNEAARKKIIEILKMADIGIENIFTVEFSKGNIQESSALGQFGMYEKEGKIKGAMTEHKYYDASNKEIGTALLNLIANESEGSIKMFEISNFLLKALKDGRPMIMDEFDARFHPLLSKKIVALFNSLTNEKSQFIFATHDVNLLSAKLLRRDQIAFVEKDKYGGSHMYTLADFKGVRNDASFEKDYIQGKYGAIPFLNEFNTPFED